MIYQKKGIITAFAEVEEMNTFCNKEDAVMKITKCLNAFGNNNLSSVWLYIGNDLINAGARFCICKNYKKGFEVVEYKRENEMDVYDMSKREVKKMLMNYVTEKMG